MYLNMVHKRFRATYDSEGDDNIFFAMNILLHINFQVCKGRLYYHDMQHLLNKNVSHTMTNAPPSYPHKVSLWLNKIIRDIQLVTYPELIV